VDRKPEQKPKRKRGGIADMRRTFGMLALRRREIWILVVLAVALAMFEGLGVGLLAPVLQYIQYGSKATSGGSGVWKMLYVFARDIGMPITLLSLLVLAFTPVLIRQFVYFAYSWYTAVVQQRAATRLRSEGFGALVHGDLAFVIREGQGNLVSCLTAQVMRGGAAIFQYVQLISIGLLIAMYVAVLAALEPTLTLIAVVTLGLISFMVKSSITRSRALGAETAVRNNEVYTVIGERIAAIRLIKMLGQEDRDTELVTTAVRTLEEVQVRIAISRGIIEITIDPAQMLAVFAIIFTGVQYFHASLASLGLFLFVLLRLNGKAKDFSIGRQTLSANIDSLEYVKSMVDRAKESRVIRSGDRPFAGLKQGIEFRNVSFSYQDEEGSELVLKDINLTIPRGHQIALVGRSGAGKSTLVDLLPRLREATSGDVFIDGVPIAEFDLRGLRRSIGFMTQDALLFNDTIYNNLIYGLERTPTDEEVAHALAQAFCTDFVEELPDGLRTNVGDRGVRLSGGQRQRLSLARVFLQDPDILILDEPTSALDSESEEYIQRALATVHGVKTLVVIAHRLSTVQRSDEILVLDKGVILERGKHAELLEQAGAYRRLFELQIYQ
jgi:subfamily B ATP-binding cassette protein MsbA